MTLRAPVAAALLAALAATVPPAAAQMSDRGVVASPVLTVDQDELFEQSAFGRRILDEIETGSAELGAENRRIEAELAAEERSLTDRRPGMDPEDFRTLATAFDEKVVEIRRTQDQKAREIGRLAEDGRQQFFREVLPILAEVVRERGALAILDSRAVILSADAIDITQEAVARIDARLGDGAGLPLLAPATPAAPGATDPDQAPVPPDAAPPVPPGDGPDAVPPAAD
jgi:Skp family chaperone for outer membrane proteins